MQSNILRKIVKIFKIIFLLICIIIMMACISIIIQSNIDSEKIPNIFGVKPMIVLTGTMETELYTYDLALIKEVDIEQLKPGDVIAFRNSENKITTHRIVEIENNDGKLEFITKGDNNSYNDLDKIKEEQIEGKYFGKISGIGRFMMYIQEPQGLAMTLIIILLIGLIWIFMGGNEEAEKKQDTKIEKEKSKKITEAK